MISLWDSILKKRRAPLDETTAYLTSANLLEVVQRGTGKRAKKLGHLAAGKTGTLDYDVWFAGYTWARTAVTWLGSDRYERPLGFFGKSGMLGGTIALPAWLEFMKQVDVERPQRRLPTVSRPKDIELVYIDRKTGLLGDNSDILMPHILGTAPIDKAFEENSPENIEDQEGEF